MRLPEDGSKSFPTRLIYIICEFNRSLLHPI